MLVDRLLIYVLLDKPTTFKVLALYRTTISRDILGLPEARLNSCKQINTSTRHICLIIVLLSLRHNFFTLMYTTLASRYMGEYKPYIVSDFVSFVHGCVLIRQNRSNSVPTTYSLNVRVKINSLDLLMILLQFFVSPYEYHITIPIVTVIGRL